MNILENKSYFTIKNRYNKNCYVYTSDLKTEYKFFYKYFNMFIKKKLSRSQIILVKIFIALDNYTYIISIYFHTIFVFCCNSKTNNQNFHKIFILLFSLYYIFKMVISTFGLFIGMPIFFYKCR